MIDPLLGAIRHKGFIPWDDDIDIQMPRPDYDKFVGLYNSVKSQSDYYAIEPYSKMSKHSFIKVINKKTIKIEPNFKYEKTGFLGIDIDIFPLDGQPESYDDFLTKVKKIKNLNLILSFKNSSIQGKSWKGIIFWLFCSLLNKKIIAHLLERQYHRDSYEDSAYIGTMCTVFDSINNWHEKSLFEEKIFVYFEKFQLWAPAGYNKILMDLYSEYMVLPPSEERVTHHSNTCFWKLK